jgi:hydrogenase maturation protease
MTESILIAGIGNIFNGDDGFGVAVASALARMRLPESVRVADYGIRGIDLAFALMDGYDVAILVDAVSRGEAPGTLYTIEPDLDGISEDGVFEGAHGLNPVKVLAMAKSMGARFGRVLVLGCEPATLGDDSGFIGLSEPVAAAVEPAAQMIRELVCCRGAGCQPAAGWQPAQKGAG